MLCPACNKPYEYCHGEFKIPYFRHKDKNECEDIYSEPESEEHIKGKCDLFEWIKRQEGVTDAILEGWIPITHQRPDIMFNYDNKQFVIEYQCTPIASEYVKRHNLYKAAGIVDLWIVGTENFGAGWCKRRKLLEDYAFGYYDSNFKNFHYEEYSNYMDLDKIDLSSMKSISLKLSQKLVSDQNYKQKLKDAKIFVTQNYGVVANYLNTLKKETHCCFNFCDNNSRYYLSKMYCNFNDGKRNSLIIFINLDSIDVCYYNGNCYQTIYAVHYNTFDLIAFEKIVLMIVFRYYK